MVEEDLGLEILLDERTEDPCEHPNHSSSSLKLHEGAGEWLVRANFFCCARGVSHLLICDRYKTVLEAWREVICKDCLYVFRGSDFKRHYSVLGRKGVDF